jgi:threonine/homoserine/homoserine lactone efflux protein
VILLLLKGFLVGLILMLFVGPSFFYLIRIGITQGFAHAASFAFGVILSDLFLLLIIIRGLSGYFESVYFQMIFSLIAGLLILTIGVLSLVKKMGIPQKDQIDKPIKRHERTWFVVKGFGINILNPFTALVWITVIGTVEIKWAFTSQEYPVFIGGVLLTVFSLDVLKAYLANYLGKLINEKTLRNVNRILGIVFLVLGFRLLYHFYQLYRGGDTSDILQSISNVIT